MQIYALGITGSPGSGQSIIAGLGVAPFVASPVDAVITDRLTGRNTSPFVTDNIAFGTDAFTGVNRSPYVESDAVGGIDRTLTIGGVSPFVSDAIAAGTDASLTGQGTAPFVEDDAAAEASSGSQVAILDAWTQESTSIGSPGAKAISAGTDRLLLVETISRGSPGAVTFTGVSYGGQSMTLVEQGLATAGPDLQLAVWSLDEAGIAAASGTSFSLTPSSGVAQFRLAAASYDNVDQAAPILDSFVAVDEAGGNPASEALDTVDQGIALAFLGANRGTSDGGATEDSSYSNMTEALEAQGSQSYYSIATSDTDGTPFTPGTTLTHQTAGSLIGLTLQ